MGHLFTQQERVEQQKAADAEAIERWNAAFAAAGGDIRLTGMEIPRIPYAELFNPATGEYVGDSAWVRSGMLGKDTRPRIIVPLPDGRPFRAVARSAYDTDRDVLRKGHPDPSGEAYGAFNLNFRSVNGDGEICKPGRGVMYSIKPITQQLVAVPCLNEFDAGPPMSDEDFAELLFNLDLTVCTFTNNPAVTLTVEEYQIFMAGHPEFKWTGYTRIEPWIPEKE